MSPLPWKSSPTRWMALAAVAVLAVGLATAYRQSRAPRPPAPAPRPAPALEDPDEDVVERALAQIPGPVDSAVIKARWQDEIRGVDFADLGEERREVFLRFANARRCTCGCGFTLAACRAYDTTCPVSLPIVEALLDSVRTGHLRDAAGVRERPSAAPAGG